MSLKLKYSPGTKKVTKIEKNEFIIPIQLLWNSSKSKKDGDSKHAKREKANQLEETRNRNGLTSDKDFKPSQATRIIYYDFLTIF